MCACVGSFGFVPGARNHGSGGRFVYFRFTVRLSRFEFCLNSVFPIRRSYKLHRSSFGADSLFFATVDGVLSFFWSKFCLEGEVSFFLHFLIFRHFGVKPNIATWSRNLNIYLVKSKIFDQHHPFTVRPLSVCPIRRSYKIHRSSFGTHTVFFATVHGVVSFLGSDFCLEGEVGVFDIFW